MEKSLTSAHWQLIWNRSQTQFTLSQIWYIHSFILTELNLISTFNQTHFCTNCVTTMIIFCVTKPLIFLGSVWPLSTVEIGITTLSPFLRTVCHCLVILVSESACVCCPDNESLQAQTIFELVISEKKSASGVSSNVSGIKLQENTRVCTRSVCPQSDSVTIFPKSVYV